MSPWVAVVVSWIAIVVLYLGLAACLREIRLLRGQVSRLTYPAGAASDSACPLCRLVLARLADLSSRLPEPAVLLTYESDDVWGPLPAGIRVVRDDPSWSAVAHLTPPVLMLVAPSGEVLELALPAGPDDVDRALESFRTFYSRH
ncbi:hypothetical protein MM440_10610 [Arsenicicoccus piscis]|uniref:Thioredoxin n=1 Tax=Arsenicicoccus piscis TaxID=673954 RepID=A0ABQ6HLA9_9MICO|nr:hypothetical protein [Arsenicicoccus piscis]MCH8628215.1 hypothetical protein [Arsenicicoccus piscis]GMA18458.1 hypothetical protein GCM10025862_04790 [Arsenicicoccus piscis]